jgi:chromosome segregation ATPase
MMNDPFLMTIIIAVITGVVVLIVLAWLIRSYLKLKNEYQVLVDTMPGLNKDIANLSATKQTLTERMATKDEQISLLNAKVSDLYAAKQTLDRYITTTDEQISLLNAKVSGYQHQQSSNNSYSSAIHKARNGASVSELMQNLGLSQDEATLLIRLHGSPAGL